MNVMAQGEERAVYLNASSQVVDATRPPLFSQSHYAYHDTWVV